MLTTLLLTIPAVLLTPPTLGQGPRHDDGIRVPNVVNCSRDQLQPPRLFGLDPSVCYKYFPSPSSFEQAAATCLRERATLPLLESNKEVRYLGKRHPTREFPTAWSASGHCVYLTKRGIRNRKLPAHAKEATNCFNNLLAPFYCVYDLAEEKCGGGEWLYHRGSCFKTKSRFQGYTFDEAEAACRLDGAHSASIFTRFENEIGKFLMPKPFDRHREGDVFGGVWLGLRLHWHNCDANNKGRSCNDRYVLNAEWADRAHEGATYTDPGGLLPLPIFRLERRNGSYPWYGMEPGSAQPDGTDVYGKDLGTTCAHYFNQADWNVGDWGDENCDRQKFQAVICRKQAVNARQFFTRG